jgi:hypothetical protein
MKANKPKKHLDSRVLKRVVDKIVARIVSMLRSRGIDRLNPLELKYAVNGSDTDAFLRRTDASTSAGFGFPGGKEKYMPRVSGVERVLLEQVQQLLADVSECFERGESVHFVYDASLKDEPRDLRKVDAGKTRVFYISPLPLLLLQRMYLSPFYTLMVQHGDIFCTAIGVNMHREAQRLREHLLKKSNLWMEGDYGGYDLQMPFEIGLAAATVVHNVLQELGYNSHALTLVTGILHEGLFPYVHLNGNVFCVPALQPSGKYATAEDNSLRGLIMLAYAWEVLCPDHDFFEYVVPLLYGDDMLAAVDEKFADSFNNITYSQFVDTVYGMEFTTASKESVSKPFVSPDEASFLKRTWARHPALGTWVAPLATDSIFKMLEWREPSDEVSEYDQTLSCIQSALRESFFHLDAVKYTGWREYLLSVVRQNWGDDITDRARHEWPTYDALVSDFGSEIVCESREIYETELKEAIEKLSKLDRPVKLKKSYKQARSGAYFSDLTYQREIDAKYLALSEIEVLENTVEAMENHLNRLDTGEVWTESDAHMDVGLVASSTEEKRQNVIDIGGQAENLQIVDEKYDPSHATPLGPSLFFERPVDIATVSLAVGADTSQQLNVWSLLSLEPSVRAKLRNFSLMRANLEITIDVSASPFHYGRILVAYIPKVASNEIANAYTTASSLFRTPFLTYLSQTRGARVMDLRENKPLTMVVPYINFQPFCRLYNYTSSLALGSATPISDLANMGTLFIYTMNPLAASNSSAPSTATVYVYARFVDCVVAAPTASQTVVQTESKAEMETGPVEEFASGMERASAALTRVPIISQWARPAMNVFSNLRMLAAYFGWSAPRVDPAVTPPELMQNVPFQNNATTVTRSTAQKLAFDNLQCNNIDPRVVSVAEDELSLSFISSIRAYLTTFVWNAAATPMSTILWSCACHPALLVPYAIASSRAFCQPVPCSYVARMFDFWTGELEFTFDFVASMLHRGKVMIQIEPNIAQYALVTASPALNKNYAVVLDLQETQTISVC